MTAGIRRSTQLRCSLNVDRRIPRRGPPKNPRKTTLGIGKHATGQYYDDVQFKSVTPENRRRQLEYSLMLFEAEQRVPPLIQGVRDIYEHRHILKQLSFSEAIVAHFAKTIRVALETGQRFRQFESLKVLRSAVVAGNGKVLPAIVVCDLFAIYRSLILKSREEIQWCLSRLIKDRELTDTDVKWLVAHWKQSVHITNRLLRYPTRNLLVEKWAKERYGADDVPGRRSEIIALLLHEGIDSIVNEKPDTMAWAIMQARVPRDEKVR